MIAHAFDGVADLPALLQVRETYREIARRQRMLARHANMDSDTGAFYLLSAQVAMHHAVSAHHLHMDLQCSLAPAKFTCQPMNDAAWPPPWCDRADPASATTFLSEPPA